MLTFLVVAAWPAGAGAQGTPLKLIFSTPPTTYALPHFVAKDLGWLDKAGLHVEEIWLTGGANAVRALIAGQGDLSVPGVSAVFSAIAEGARIRAIASWQPTVDYQLLAGENVKGFADLAGARIGAAGANDITTEIPRMLMKKHGVETSRTAFVAIGGHEARVQAIVAGKVDAAIVGLLYAMQAKALGRVHVLTTIREEFPGMGYVYVMANEKDLASEKRRALETYVRLGVIEASRFIVKNPDKAAEIMHARTPALKLELIREVVGGLSRLNVWGVNGGLEPEITGYSVKQAYESGSIKRALRADEVIDRTIVEKLLREVGTM
jgi:ABC-type nitrate/sulfonate/bicarbonate transport system substrate-binding protein